MNKNHAITVLIISLVLLALLGCNSQSPAPTATHVPAAPLTTATVIPSSPTPTIKPTQVNKTQLVNGEVDTCLLLMPEEVENVLGIKVQSAPVPFKGATGCKYFTADDKQYVVLLITAFTDTTLKKADMNYTSTFWFEQTKKIHSEMGFYKMIDLPDLGEQAYYQEGSLNNVDILKNDIFYDFNSRPTKYGKEFGGFMDMETLIKVAKVAMQRTP